MERKLLSISSSWGSVTLSLPRACHGEVVVAASFLPFHGQVRRYVTVPRVKAGVIGALGLAGQVHDRSVSRATFERIAWNRSTLRGESETAGPR